MNNKNLFIFKNICELSFTKNICFEIIITEKLNTNVVNVPVVTAIDCIPLNVGYF